MGQVHQLTRPNWERPELVSKAVLLRSRGPVGADGSRSSIAVASRSAGGANRADAKAPVGGWAPVTAEPRQTLAAARRRGRRSCRSTLASPRPAASSAFPRRNRHRRGATGPMIVLSHEMISVASVEVRRRQIEELPDVRLVAGPAVQLVDERSDQPIEPDCRLYAWRGGHGRDSCDERVEPSLPVISSPTRTPALAFEPASRCEARQVSADRRWQWPETRPRRRLSAQVRPGTFQANHAPG
jgi:hypothetical protein